MSKYSPIKRQDNWFAGERKRFEWPITDASGNAVDLSGIDLEWRLLPHRGSVGVLLIKSPDDFETPEGDDHNIAVWEVDEDDYDDLTAGWMYHQLWDLTNNTCLSEGGAFLNPSSRSA